MVWRVRYLFGGGAMRSLENEREGRIRPAAAGPGWLRHATGMSLGAAFRIRPPPPKIADLRKKIGDFYFFTITYSLFTKSSRRFLESNK